MDVYGGSLAVVCIAIAECVGLLWVYGIRRLCDDLQFMLNEKINIYWKVTWTVCAPVILSVSK